MAESFEHLAILAYLEELSFPSNYSLHILHRLMVLIVANFDFSTS